MEHTLAIVVPCYNEEEVLEKTTEVLRGVLKKLINLGKISPKSYILYVNDGSKDHTWELIVSKHKETPDMVMGMKLSGNVGHQNALIAGLFFAAENADVTVSIDADLQDDVDVIEEMVDKYLSGKDIVYGVRRERKTDTAFKRMTAQGFYKVMALMGVKSIYNHADFRLMSKRAVIALSKYKERNLYLRGIIPLLGYETDCVYYDRKERFAGKSKYPLKKMLELAFNGISSFSVKPITLILGLGCVISSLSAMIGIITFLLFIAGADIPSFAGIMLSVWFLGGMQLFAIGLIGEYVGKVYVETKERPRYNVERTTQD